MSAQQPQGPPPGAGEPTDEEIRAAYEAQLSQISATDMIAQSVVSLLNIGAFRISGPAEGQPPAPDDLAQARTAAGREADHPTALVAMADDGYDLGEQGAGTTAPTLGDLLDASEAPGALNQAGTSDMVTDLGVDPAAEIPATLGDLLDASHPLSLHDELAAAQVSVGTVPTATPQAMDTSLTADIGLG